MFASGLQIFAVVTPRTSYFGGIMSVIYSVRGSMILDSRDPAVEVEVVTENFVIGQAAVPSGANTVSTSR